jgi:hypothetical protein
MTSKPNPRDDLPEPPPDPEAIHAKLVEHYAEEALAGIADTIPASDVPRVRAALIAFFAANPRATQLIEQLVVSQPVERSGTTVRRDPTALAAAVSGGKRQ